MTLKRYLFEPALSGHAVVADLGDEEGRPWVALDQTWFHPQGGGQKPDRGTLAGVSVVHVAHADGDVRHYVETTAGLQVGELISITVDPAWRRDNSALHTSGHLIAAVGERIYPTLKAVAGHHWPDEARVEFEGDPPSDLEEFRRALLFGIEEAIRADWPVRVIGDPLSDRTIQIGEFTPLPCGGTHLNGTRELNRVDLSGVKRKGGRLRVSYSA